MEGIEVWLEIEEAKNYEVSSLGNVRHRIRKRNFKKSLNSRGYQKVGLRIDGRSITRSVHGLVAKTFFDGNHTGFEPNHDDGDKTNNFIGNLEWVTHLENMHHAYRYGLVGTAKGGSKKIPVRIIETDEIFESLSACARAIGGRYSCIVQCIQGRQRSHMGYTFEYIEN